MPTAPSSGGHSAAESLADAVNAYRDSANVEELLEAIHGIAQTATPEELAMAVEPFISIPEVAGPVYEYIVEKRPDDARGLVILANAYWLSGRGPEVVGELATRAISVDPANRGAWHLWALSESDIRERVGRWMQVSARFPADDLAKVSLADNAASLASAEHDHEALALALRTYEGLFATATHPAQRDALDKALRTLRGWRL